MELIWQRPDAQFVGAWPNAETGSWSTQILGIGFSRMSFVMSDISHSADPDDLSGIPMNPSVRQFLLMMTLLLAAAPEIYAQDSTQYKVRIAPAMTLDALSPDRTATHPMTGSDVTFSNQLWSARTTSGSGSTVRFTTDTAFRHVNSPIFKRDARLRLTRISGNTSARWRFDVADDRTDYASGDENASVQVSCTGPGNATITMNVLFLTGNLATLQGGQYQITVTGTISEN